MMLTCVREMKAEQERVKTVLTDTVSLLCKNGLSYKRELKIQAVIGVTVDDGDVFLVHIDESFSAHGASSTTAAAAQTSMAVVPFSRVGTPHAKREFEAARTPTSSGVKRMRAEGISMSPSSDMAKRHAKQQLRFASPAKSDASSMPPGLSARAPRAADVMCRGGRGSARGAMRGARRAGVGRPGFHAGRSQRGVSRGAAMPDAVRGTVPGAVRAHRLPTSSSLGHQLPTQPRYDVKFTPGQMSHPATSDFHMTSSSSSSSAGGNSSVGFNFSAYQAPASATFATAASDRPHQPPSSAAAANDLPVFSSSEQDRFVNAMPTGFDFDRMFPSDNSGSTVLAGSFDDINPSLEFGFPPSCTASNIGGGFAGPASSVHCVNASDIKTESLDDDVIFVDDDVVEPSAAAADDAAGGGGSDVSDAADGVAGAAVQQITRRVTITTNIQGQNVKYEQVC